MNDVQVSALSALTGNALLVSADPPTIDLLRASLQQLAISTEICVEAARAPDLLNRRKFGAIIVDEQPGNRLPSLLEKVRRSPSNRTSVSFAIIDNDADTAVAFKEGFNFVLRRPLSESSVDPSLRAAYGLILREQRRYFRCQVDIAATLRHSGMQEFSGQVVNISEGGIAVSTGLSLKPGVEVQVQFVLPGYEYQFATQSVVCWCKEEFIGLRFISLSAPTKAKLQEWLSRRLEHSLPESVANKFRTLKLR
jgi:CheY-like chemotaxis protein